MTTTDSSIEKLVQPEDPLPPTSLADLPASMQAAAARAGWTTLTPVQTYGIPYLRARRDMMIQARTGSGKTGAFVLSIVERIDTSKPVTQALVLAPTRELANQVTEEAHLLAGDSGLRAVPVYGGVGYGPQVRGFKEGAHLVVGTPGRILDHLLKRNLNLDDLQVLVFDEADRMLSMGFYPDMQRLQGYLPDTDYTAAMFSATFPPHVQSLARQFLDEAGFLSLSRDHVHVTDTQHVLYTVPGMQKDRILVKIIELENPAQAIIFCNTKDRVHYVARVLQRFGYNADELSSDLSQSKREQVLARVREGKLRFLVATDVASRGLDIPELSHVFQYELPEEHELYIHRAGRTGRAGASGVAITLAATDDMRYLKRVQGVYKIEFEERDMPTDEDVQSTVSQRLAAILEQRLRDRDRLQVERMKRFEPLLDELLANEEGRALLTMLLDDTYHNAQHQPPDLPPIGTASRDEGQASGGGGRRRPDRRKRG
ncbi:MAG: DEAD/DEAH box helicase [Anaerolineae bacterium]|nr:MAG: DEAD/DEAH box helicase [Anaerolineae bacterium]